MRQAHLNYVCAPLNELAGNVQIVVYGNAMSSNDEHTISRYHYFTVCHYYLRSRNDAFFFLFLLMSLTMSKSNFPL